MGTPPCLGACVGAAAPAPHHYDPKPNAGQFSPVVVVGTPRLVGIWQLFVLSQLHGPAAQTPVGSGQVLQGCANFNPDRNRNMPDHGLRPKASRQQEPRLPSQALTQGCISLLPYQLNNVKLHYLVVQE